MTNVVDTGIPGCVQLRPQTHEDARGTFAKPFARSAFEQLGLSTDWAEAFWSTSHRGVVRGFHLPLPPHDHDKLVICVAGETHNVVLDLRKGSPAFGKTAPVQMSKSPATALFVPCGVAHAFQAMTSDATLLYLVGSEHVPSHDGGVRWDSAGISWPLEPTAVSARDAALPALGAYVSPFQFLG
jgi:dTDP-4-dehydrorhamnose 3,5-epimerase